MNHELKILVVDDNDIFLGAMSNIISLLGYEVVSANNGDDGWDLFLTKPYDIVFTDFDMPGKDGISFAYHMKTKSPDTQVVLMTGHDRETVLKHLNPGAVDLILFKPFDMLKIEKVLAKSRTRENQSAEHFEITELEL